jgi:pimeloyl-ACP methyl ester carboxylesterase
MPNIIPTAQSAGSFAEVRAHDQVMRYRRAGAGRPILVLRSSLEPEPLWPELDEALVGAFRVLTPDVPCAGVDVAAWMRGFLEGVGLDRVTVIAEDLHCIAALEMALLNGDQVERMVLVPAGQSNETGLDGTLATSLAGVAVPLLVVRRGLSADEAVPLLMQFLEQGSTTTAAG